MNTNPYQRSNNCRPNPLSVRLPAIALYEKAAFVEDFCDTLIESRFGPGRVSQLIVRLNRPPGTRNGGLLRPVGRRDSPLLRDLPDRTRRVSASRSRISKNKANGPRRGPSPRTFRRPTHRNPGTRLTYPGNAGALACKRPALRTLTNAMITKLKKTTINLTP